MKKILKQLKQEDSRFRRRLLVTGYLTQKLAAQEILPVIVGGHAVEIYTFQDYATQDLDLVIANRHLAGELLEQLGFEKLAGARHWINTELDLAIEIPDDLLAGDYNRLLELVIADYTVYIIGVEDLIIDRLNAYVHWKSISDYEQALKIYITHQEKIDEEYLEKQAKANQVLAGLEHLHRDFQAFSTRT